MTWLEELALNIREARQGERLTQRQLAQRIGMTMSAVSNYENARRAPSLRVMSTMSSVLRMSLDDLVPLDTCEMRDDENQTTIYDFI